MAGFACDTPVVPGCNRLQSFGTFTNGDFGGGMYAYGNLTFDMTDSSVLHVTGSVSTYSGFGIYFNACSTLAAYTGVSFMLTGGSASAEHPNELHFLIRSNADTPVDPVGHYGTCVGAPGVECVMPEVDVAVSSSPRTVLWTDLTGGKPIATLDPRQVLGFQWEIAPDTTHVPFSVDLELDDVTLLGGADPPTDCAP
jgi:hypothetical protein